MNYKCYSQRLLNPFRGMLNIIEYNSAEAVTMDGLVWDIYVRNSTLVKDLELSQATSRRIQTSEIRYGQWSKKTGLRRGPTIESDDFNEMAAIGDQVFEYLLTHYHEIPFPYQDKYELWLLDKNNNPLALLFSEVYPEEIVRKPNIKWTSGITCQQSFSSTFIAKNITTEINSARYLNNLINNQSNNSAQWILRSSDGSGTGLEGINLDTTLINRKIAIQNIPTKLINSCIFNKNDQQILDEYFEWLAPWLLVLQSISNDFRKELEQQASSNALIIDKLHHLYPNIIDQAIINSALVETQLRKNQASSNNNATERVESVEYLELNNPTFHLNK